MIIDRFLQLIINIAIGELVLIGIVILLIIIFHGIIKYVNIRDKKNRKELATIFLEAIEEKQPFSFKSITKKLTKPFPMLSIIEDINSKFTDDHWKKIKTEVLNQMLFPLARKWYRSSSWIKRNFSIRCFALLPLKEDEEKIVLLLQDKKTLIRLSASLCAVTLGTPKLLEVMFDVMKKEPEKGRYAYRDAVLRGNINVFSWIREQIKLEENSDLRLIYLDLLSSRYDSSVLLYIKKDLQSDNQYLRLKAIKILGKFPSKESVSLMLPYLNDPYYLIRAEILAFIPGILREEAFDYLKEGMKDEMWWVRLQAALGMKKLKEKGLNYLKNVSQEEKDMYDLAQYVLSIPEE
jgi:hypothetical protein